MSPAAGTTRRGGPCGTGGRAAVVAAVAALVATLGYAGHAVAAALGDEVLGPGVVTVTIAAEHSHFEPDRLKVRAGTVVEFVLDNRDPIHHELIVGPPAVHELHEDGDHHLHPPIPGEVAVGPLETGSTLYEFDEPGTVAMACHLPGHVDYGMVGSVEVVP